MPLDPAVHARIQSLLAQHRVLLFMKGEPQAPQCGFSAKAVAALSTLGIDYGHVDVLADPELREGIKQFGDWPTIPQLYVDGELVGGSDIVAQMAASGELHATLGLPPPDRTPPTITITPAAAAMLREAIANAGEGYALQVALDPRCNASLQLAPVDADAIALECEGVRAQLDLASAQRANGLSIDWVDDARGRGLVVEHPDAAPRVRALSPLDAASRVAAGTVVVVDVRPASERAFAQLKAGFMTLDDGGDAVTALARDTPLAFLCHHGGRSAQAAEHFRGLGFSEVYNVTGGIDAWSDLDPVLPKY